MASSSLLPQSAPDSGRISQILPSVRCSNCNQPVPINELEGHVCAVLPVTPSSSLSSLLPQRLQTLVSLPRSNSAKPSDTLEHTTQASSRRSRGFSLSSKKVGTSAKPPPPTGPPMVILPVQPPPRTASRGPFLPSTTSRGNNPAPSQQLPPTPPPPLSSSTSTSSASVSSSRARAPSVTSNSTNVHSRPSLDVSRNRSPSPRPSFDSTRSRNLSSATTSSVGGSSYDSLRTRTPDISQLRVPIRSSSSNNSIFPGRSDANHLPQSNHNELYVPHFTSPPASIPVAYEPSTNHKQHQPFHRRDEPDTKIGGEAGMAGVGRRGFQAAARAALLTVSAGTDKGRPNAPQLLDIGRAINTTNTPPLSPSGHSSPHSPVSPFSRTSEDFAGSLPASSSGDIGFDVLGTSHSPVIIPSKTPSPTNPGNSPFSERSISTPLPSVDQDHRSPPTKDFQLYDDYDDDDDDDERPFSPMTESDFGGLAYASSVDHEGHERNDLPTASRKRRTNQIEFPSMSPRSNTSSISVYSPRLPTRSLSIATSVSDYMTRPAFKSTGALDRAMEALFEDIPPSPTDSVVSASGINHPFLASAPTDGYNSMRDSSSRPKLPIRALTSPCVGKPRNDAREGKKASRSLTYSSSSSSVPRKYRDCAGCGNNIQVGKWISMDGGGVLCDQCWKNMYLPKCRRCNLPIEKQAVSSSDGQLKGKYHRDCFNCHSCHKPFPDKTFYVFDGKPFCEYHYHEANGSLCAAPTCGNPIEGPCAVSHAGDKYHPDHLICDYPRCTERLEEYWEVDGRMLCETHMQMEEEVALLGGGDLVDDMLMELGVKTENFRNSVRAMKRVTRFIDIAGLGNNGPK